MVYYELVIDTDKLIFAPVKSSHGMTDYEELAPDEFVVFIKDSWDQDPAREKKVIKLSTLKWYALSVLNDYESWK